MSSKSLKTILKQIHNRINYLVRECLKLVENGYKILVTFNNKISFEFDFNTITRWLYGRCIINGLLYRYFIDSKDDFMFIIECLSKPNVYFLNLTRYVYNIYFLEELKVYEVIIHPLPLNKEVQVNQLTPSPKGDILIEPYKEYHHEIIDFSNFEKLKKIIQELRELVLMKIDKYVEYYRENDLPSRRELSIILYDQYMPRWRARKRILFDRCLRDQLIKLRLFETQNEVEDEHLYY